MILKFTYNVEALQVNRFFENLKNYNVLILCVNIYGHINAILHGKDDKVIFRCDIKPQK